MKIFDIRAMGVTRKIALAAGVLGAMFGFVLGLMTLFSESAQRIETAQLNADRIIRSTLPQAERAYWEVDVSGLRTILSGLLEDPVISKVWIEDPLLTDALRASSGLDNLTASDPAPENIPWITGLLFQTADVAETQAHILRDPREGNEIGRLVTEFSFHPLRKEMTARSLVVLGSSVLQALLVTAVVFLVVQIVVIRPIARLQGAALRVRDGHRFELNSRDQRMFDLTRRDEISRLARAFRRTVTELEASRDNLQELVDERTDELVVARNQALEASKAKSVFLANMSHELRTPLNAIIGLSEILIRNGQTGKVQRHLTDMRAAAAQLSANIDSVLDHSKIEAGQLALEQTWFSLDDFLDDILTQTRALMTDKAVRLMTDYAENLPRHICSDPLRLRQIITNLASNAVKFTFAGEIVLCVRCVHGADDTARLTFSVRDSGIGIAQGQIDEIFKPFGQADSSTTRQFGGTGLGLSIAHGLAGQMHGKLNVKSTLGKGSCFSLDVTFTYRNEDQDALGGHSVNITGTDGPMRQIQKVAVRTGYALGDENADFSVAVSTQSVRFFGPLKPDVIVEELALPITHREFLGALRGLNEIDMTPLATFHGKDILIVEDNRINLSVFVSLIQALGANTRTAQNGLEAVAQVANAMPDAILIDLHMPLMDGYAALEVLMAAHGTALPPAVATSANATPEEDRRCKVAGFIDFLPKPVDPEKLKAVLDTAISYSVPAPVLDRARGVFLAGDNETLYEQNIARFSKSLTAWSQELAVLAQIPDPSRLADLLHVIKGAAGTLAAGRVAQQATAVETDSKTLGALQVGIADLLKEIGGASTPLAIPLEKPDISLNGLLDCVRARDVFSLDVARAFMAAGGLNEGKLDYPALVDALEKLDFIEAERILIMRHVSD